MVGQALGACQKGNSYIIELASAKIGAEPYIEMRVRRLPGASQDHGVERPQRIANKETTDSVDTEEVNCRCPRYGEGAPVGKFAQGFAS